jgi:hypothetical protein
MPGNGPVVLTDRCTNRSEGFVLASGPIVLGQYRKLPYPHREDDDGSP